VSIRSEDDLLNLTTQTGLASSEPYFAAALSDLSPYAPGEPLAVVEATHNGQSNAIDFIISSGSQQVDVYLSSTCGPTSLQGGPITTDTTWTPACSPYLVSGNILVQDGVTLTIKAGTNIYFEADKSLQMNGVLSATGLPNGLIKFSSSADQDPGAWGNISFVDNNAIKALSNFHYGIVEYAGGVTINKNGALRVDGAHISMSHLTVRHNLSDGIRVFNHGITDMSSLTIHDNDGWGINIASDQSIMVTSCAVYDNKAGGINIEGGVSGIVSGSHIRGNGGSGISCSGSPVFIGGNSIVGNSGNWGGGINFGSATAHIKNNTIHANTASGYGGGIYCTSCGYAEIYENLILDNRSEKEGGGMYFNGGQSEIKNNIFCGNTGKNGGGLRIGGIGPFSEIFKNVILNNQATENGAGVYVTDKDAFFSFNTIIFNTAGTGMAGVNVNNHPVFNDNNIHYNTNYDFYNGNLQGSEDVNAQSNWWGAAEESGIASRIWDWYDDATLGLVSYTNYLHSHQLNAPISPPTDVQVFANGITVTLVWSPNSEYDLAGYKLYYDSNGPGPIYLGTGANQGDSPIDVGNMTVTSLTGLPPGKYYLAVTAYDLSANGIKDQTDGNESWYADGLTAHIGGKPLADFTAYPTSGIVPLSVSFTDISTGTLDNWVWEFGDSFTSTQQHPTHTYAITGTFPVTLTVSGPTGTDTITKPNYITTLSEFTIFCPMVQRE
jgi:hypothetical protein